MKDHHPEKTLPSDKIPHSRRDFLARTTLMTGGTFFAGPLAWIPAHPQEAQDRLLPIPEQHFPSRMHLFVWRNWELVNTDSMTKILGTAPERVLDLGSSMGLPAKPVLTADQLRRIYITIIRQNWHVLPEDQLIELLGWDREHYEFTLREDDFLAHKLGPKPDCERVTYAPPSPSAETRAREIRSLVERTFGDTFREQGEPPFQFVSDLSSTDVPSMLDPDRKPADREIDLNEWTLIDPAGGDTALGEVLGNFRSYMEKAFRCALATSPPEAGGSKPRSIRIELDPRLDRTRDSFEIQADSSALTIRAADAFGARKAVFLLQDLMEERGAPFLPEGTYRRAQRLNPVYLYSYFALYGDPLMQDDIDPFPDGYLEKLGRLGVRGVWLQAVLRNLAPSSTFPEFGQGWQKRLSTLNRLVQRAKRHGVKVYLYLNEPRAMPEEFFRNRPEMRGTPDSDPRYFAMCSSAAPVRRWMEESLDHIFREVPELGGIFSITMSENLTNCYSKGRAEFCPRCGKREGAEVVAEVIQVFRDGVRRRSPNAEIIAWDWGWGHDWVRNGAVAEDIIRRLPQDVKLLSVSEWHVPVIRGGFRTRVGEYSISSPGPGPRASRFWAVARQRGVEALAKIQVNSTWEISAVPYIPTLHLIQEHLENLIRDGVQGLMLSWTVGGCPSPNLQIAGEYCRWPTPIKEDVLGRVANQRYGGEAAPLVLKAWQIFSEAFREFPYGVAIYVIPTQHGPANLLRVTPTGHQARMILLPHDDYKRWCGPYPVEIVQSQFAKMSSAWEKGLPVLRQAVQAARALKRPELERELGIAETCHIHFRSTGNQVRFYMLRERILSGSLPAAERTAAKAEMTRIAGDELQLAKSLYRIARKDSRIGFEATNHYYYRPLDLAEKVLNCEDVIRRLRDL